MNALALIAAICLLAAPGILYAAAAGWWRRLPLPEALLAAAIASMMLVAWLGLLLAQLGRFSLANLSLAMAAVCLAIVLWARLAPGRHSGGREPIPADPSSRGGWRSHLGLAALLLITLWLYRLPGEMIFGTHDAGVRVTSAIHLAQTGSLYVSLPTLPQAQLTGSLALAPSIGVLEGNPGVITALLPDDPGRLGLPWFGGAYEVWLATAYSLFGEARIADLLPTPLGQFNWPSAPLFLYLTPLCGLLSVLALYRIGNLLFAEAVGLLGAALLAVSFPQVYYSSISMSEVPTQMLLLATAWGLARYNRDGDRQALALAGSALGIALLVRIDVLVLYGLVGLWGLYAFVTRRLARSHWVFLAPAGVLLLHAAVHYLHFAAPYFWTNARSLWQTYAGSAPLAASVVALASIAACLLRKALLRYLGGPVTWLGRPRQRRWLAVGLVVVAGYDYLVRPLFAQPREVYSPLMGEVMSLAPERALVMLGWYLSPWLLLAGVCGMALLVQRGIGWTRAPFVAAGLSFAVLLLVNAYVTPHHVFWVRRFVPVVLPFVALCAAYGVVATAQSAPRRVAPWLGVGLGAFLLANLAFITAPLVTSPPEHAGAVAQMERLGGLFPPDSVVLLERTPGAAWVALPLSLIYGQSAYLLPAEGDVGAAALAEALEGWRRQGHATYLVAERGGAKLSWRDFDFRLVGDAWFSFPYLERAYDRLPTNMINGYFNVEVYEVAPADSGAPTLPLTVDVGSGDYGYALNGWEAREREGGATYRFTGPTAALSLPWPSGQATKLTLVVSGDRPAGAPPARLRVFVADQPAGEVAFGDEQASGFNAHSFLVPPLAPDGSGGVVVRLETNAWVPAQHGLDDSRELGVAVESARVERGTPDP